LDGDGTVYAFSDPKVLGGAKPEATLMHSAAASARFPGILPPYSILKKRTSVLAETVPSSTAPGEKSGTNGAKAASNDQKQEQQRWNFVDGGYSDNSGAATGLDIYNAISNALKGSDDASKIDLLLIILSGAKIDQSFKTIKGTSFRDIIAPIDAILSVRRLLAEEVVTRVTKSFEEKNESTKLKIIELQDKLFELPLGWSISNTTFDVVSLLMGRSEHCPKGPQPDKSSRALSEVFRRNNCVMKDIKDALSPPGP
jgi:hypothetical protein